MTPSYNFDSSVYHRMLCESLALFSRDILGLDIGAHYAAWSDMITEYDRIALLAGRDLGKSTCFTYAYPIWRAWSKPGSEVYLFSKTLEQAGDYLDYILYGKPGTALRGMIEIPVLDEIVPHQSGRGKNANARARLKRADVRFLNGSRIRVAGYGKAVRGKHPKYIVLDDVLNDESMWSEMVRRKEIEYFRSAIVNMCPPGGQIINVGTPLHVADLHGWLKENPAYAYAEFPLIIKDDSTGKERALYPKRYSLDLLYKKKIEVGSLAFAREILLQPLNDDISIFPESLFPPCYDKTICLKPSKAQIKERKLTTYIGVDIARSASVGSDFFVIFVIGRDPKGNQHIIDIRRSKGLMFRQQLHEIELACQLYDPTLVFIESNAMQQLYSQELRRETDLPIKEFETLATNKYPLDKGVPGQRLLLENRKLVIPRGDQYSIDMTNLWLNECRQFGYIEGKLQGIGSHDDTVMAWWFATEASRSGGFSFMFGDGDEEEGEDIFGASDDGTNWEDVMIGDDAEEAGQLF